MRLQLQKNSFIAKKDTKFWLRLESFAEPLLLKSFLAVVIRNGIICRASGVQELSVPARIPYQAPLTRAY